VACLAPFVHELDQKGAFVRILEPPFRPMDSLLLLSGSRSDALKRPQLDHLCTHTRKGP